MAPSTRAPRPPVWAVVTGRVPIHSRRTPVVGPGSPVGAAPPPFVLNAEALQPLWRLFAAFVLVGVTYYWSQVYTRRLAGLLHVHLHDHSVHEDNHSFDSAFAPPPAQSSPG